MAVVPRMNKETVSAQQVSAARSLPLWALPAIAPGLAFCLRLGFYLIFSSRWSFNSVLPWDGWGRIAQNMAHGYGLADTNLITYFPISDVPVATAARPPLPVFVFSIILRIFGDKLLPIVITQALFDAGTALVIYWITVELCAIASIDEQSEKGRFLTSPSLAGLIAAMGFALYLPEFPYTVGFQSEPIFTLLLTGAIGSVLLYKSNKGLVGAGLLFGLAALARPAILLFPIALLPWLVWGRGIQIRRVALLPITMGLVLLPWVVRNYQVFHHIIPTETLAGYNLYRQSGQIEDENYLRWVSADECHPKILALLKTRGLEPRTISEPELDSLLKNEAISIIKAHPLRFINLCMHRASWLFLDPSVGSGDWSWAAFFYFATLLFIFGSIGMALRYSPGGWIKQLVPIWLLIGYIVSLHAIMIAQFRYMLPLIPVTLIAASYAWLPGWRAVSLRLRRKGSWMITEPHSPPVHLPQPRES